MEQLLKKLEIDPSLSDEEILKALEKKQMEYLDRLDSVEDENREKELKADLSDIESTIGSLTWTLKRRNNGIASDEGSNGIGIFKTESEEKTEEKKETLADLAANGGKSQKGNDGSKEMALAYRYLYGEGLYQRDVDAAYEYFYKAAKNYDNPEAMAMVGALLEAGSTQYGKQHNNAIDWLQASMDMDCPLGYWEMGLLFWKQAGMFRQDDAAYNERYRMMPWEYTKDYKKTFAEKEKIKEEADKKFDDLIKQAKEYFDKAVALGGKDVENVMWFWDIDALMEKGYYERVRELAENNAEVMYSLYLKTFALCDIKAAARLGHPQAQADLPKVEAEYNKREKAKKVKETTGSALKCTISFVIAFAILFIPSFFIGNYIWKNILGAYNDYLGLAIVGLIDAGLSFLVCKLFIW